jgi:hypothetical protein
MIAGATATDEGIVPIPPPPLTGPRGTLDFVNSVYNFDAGTLTLAGVVNLTARRSASGLSIIGGAPVQLLGTPLAFALLGQWTIAIEFNLTSSSSGSGERQFFATVFDAGFNDQISIYGSGDVAHAGGPSGVAFEDSGITTRTAFGNIQVGLGTNRIAGTRVTGRIAVSLAGETTVADSTSILISSWSFPPSQVQLADSSDTGITKGFIRKITFYDPVSDATLPTLSA